MPRAAGSSTHYTWVLRDSEGNYLDGECDISLPSVTSIIGAVLAKPQLVPWAYRQTRDSIAGLVSHFMEAEDNPQELLETLNDSDCLDEWLKENNMRPDDIKDEASERGTEAHEYLELLSGLDPASARERASQGLETGSVWEKGVGGWWLRAMPREYMGETKLVSLEHGFAGTCDLLWRSIPAAAWKVTDLKTRRAGLMMYDSDDIQTAGYRIAWNEMHPEDKAMGRSVLLVFDDGTFKEYPAKQPEEVFLSLLRTYKLMKPL